MAAPAHPGRLSRAVDAIALLESTGIYFVPIRHHSPACALGLEAMLLELEPAAILIEGPEEFTALLPELARAETVPPVAILSHTENEHGRSTGFYPLADYSPEWVALRHGQDSGAQVAFIDQPWSERSPDADDDEASLARSIQSERHLAHSSTLAALARREHCRDHDELWDQLFELRGAEERRDWRALFADVFAWSALARLDYEPQVLVSEGSIEREALMATRIREWRDTVTGPIVVVTGAFHTLALVEALSGAAEGSLVENAVPKGGYGPPPRTADSAWLIRYDFRRLDALGGYGAGMPSPGYYQRAWEAARRPGGAGLAVDLLVDVARGVNAQGTTQSVSTADVAAAAVQAERLAELRGRPYPGRTDILDAIESSFVKDDGVLPAALRSALDDVLSGNALGDVPAGVASPPAVAEARRRALALRLSVTDSASRRVSLDVRRKETHRARSRFLALMQFLGTGFSRRVAGPDFVAGRNLARLHEEWSYAWTPLVETALIDLSSDGVTLADMATTRLLRAQRSLEESANGRSAQSAVAIFAQAVVIGQGEQLDELAGLVGRHLGDDPALASVAGAATRLMALWAARDQFEFAESGAVPQLIARCVPAASYLVPSLATTDLAGDEAAIDTIGALRGFVRELESQSGIDVDGFAITTELDRLRRDRETTAGVAGALVAFAAVDGVIDEHAVEAIVTAQLGAGADAERAVRFLAGFMKAGPDLLVHSPELFTVIDVALRELTPDAFLRYLPELRRSFSWLKPRETAVIAERVAGTTGVRETEVARIGIEMTSSDLAAGIALERALAASLNGDGLGGWAGGAA